MVAHAMKALLLIVLVACGKPAAPNADEPVLVISLVLEGASAGAVETSVVEHVEEAAGAIRGVGAIESRIDDGHATIKLDVAAGDLDRVTHELRHAMPALPPELAPPTIVRRRKHDEPVHVLDVRGTLPVGTISMAVRDVIVPRLQRLPGVAAVEPQGIGREITVITPDLAQLDAHGATLVDVVAAMRDRVMVRPNVNVEDVATVAQSIERDATNKPAIAIHAQVGAKTSAVVAAVRDELAELRATLPPGMEVVDAAPPAKRRAPLVVSVHGAALDMLEEIADDIVARLAAQGITDVVRDPPPSEPEMHVVPDSVRIPDLKIEMADLVTTLRALRGVPVTKHERRDVVVRVGDLETAVARLTVRNRDGALVPLANVVNVTYGKRRTILRRDRERVITLAVYAKAALARKLATERALPAGYRTILTP